MRSSPRGALSNLLGRGERLIQPIAMSPQVVTVYRNFDLPWSGELEQEQRFRRTLRNCLLALLALAVLLAVLPAPERSTVSWQEVPPRLARLLNEQLPPPVVEAAPEPEPEPEPEPDIGPEEPAAEQPLVADEPAVVPEPAPVPDPTPPRVDTTEQARARASVAGLLPLAASLASLRDNPNTRALDRTEIGAVEAAPAAVAERSLLTSSVGTSSAGIRTADLSRNTGGSGIGGRSTTQVESPVAAVGGGEDAGPGGGAVRSGEDGRGSRSREEIERVFDRNKGAIYALYNRALRQDPSLEGKLVLRLTIEPDGRVSFCEVVSSELNDADLEQKLVQRVLLFQFEAKDVAAVTTTKPIDFFPA